MKRAGLRVIIQGSFSRNSWSRYAPSSGGHGRREALAGASTGPRATRRHKRVLGIGGKGGGGQSALCRVSVAGAERCRARSGSGGSVLGGREQSSGRGEMGESRASTRAGRTPVRARRWRLLVRRWPQRARRLQRARRRRLLARREVLSLCPCAYPCLVWRPIQMIVSHRINMPTVRSKRSYQWTNDT